MTKILQQNHFVIPVLLFGLVFMVACDNDTTVTQNTQTINTNAPSDTPPVIEQNSVPQPEIENKSYLFDVSDHTIEELEALLIRAEEVSQTHPADFEELKIVMILHGPDVDWFTHQNYENNRKLVDLAARLDAYEVIDMKVCEVTMQNRGVEQDDLPAFIESVPYAPVEIDTLLHNGYINL